MILAWRGMWRTVGRAWVWARSGRVGVSGPATVEKGRLQPVGTITGRLQPVGTIKGRINVG